MHKWGEKMKKLFIITGILILTILTACSDDTENSSEMIDVTIESPSEVQANEKVTISASVTQGEEKVEDADEVMFEIRKSGQDEGEMVEGTHVGDGLYTIDTIFSDEGSYIVVAHVTARNMHNMPSKTVTVGENSQTVSNSVDEHNLDYATFDFENDGKTYAVNEEITLKTNVQYGNRTLSNAKVMFEIWQENDESSELIHATEQHHGESAAAKTFDKPGTYLVNIHVEKDDIHEHYQSKIIVE